MSERTKTIHYRNLPSRPPISITVLAWLVLDRLKAPGWAWGAVGVVFLGVWVSAIVGIVLEENVDIFKPGWRA